MRRTLRITRLRRVILHWQNAISATRVHSIVQRPMMKFIYRLLGWECCGEWTQWTDRQSDFERPTDYDTDGIIAFRTDRIVFTRRWQERKCTICGKIQQRDLKQ